MMITRRNDSATADSALTDSMVNSEY